MRTGNHDIWVMNADGSNLTNLTNHPARDRYPIWSPSGKQLTFSGTTIVRMEEGKIVERWANVDELGLLQQLGVVPPPPGA